MSVTPPLLLQRCRVLLPVPCVPCVTASPVTAPHTDGSLERGAVAVPGPSVGCAGCLPGPVPAEGPELPPARGARPRR